MQEIGRGLDLRLRLLLLLLMLSVHGRLGCPTGPGGGALQLLAWLFNGPGVHSGTGLRGLVIRARIS